MPEWISYDQESAGAVMFDAELLDDQEYRSAYPTALIIEVTGFDADAQGEPTDLAAQALFGYEQALEGALEEHDCEIVVTVSDPNKYIIIGYAPSADVEGSARAVACPFKADVRTERDDTWKHYEEFALRGEELEEARDDEQISQLVDEGIEEGEEITLVFDVYLPDHDQYDEENFPTEIADILTQTVKLTPEAVKAARQKVQAAIKPFNGVYEGWGVDEDDEEPVEV